MAAVSYHVDNVDERHGGINGLILSKIMSRMNGCIVWLTGSKDNDKEDDFGLCVKKQHDEGSGVLPVLSLSLMITSCFVFYYTFGHARIALFESTALV